jgi:glycosyltransferase involved in cell wall biosynthesis
MEAITPRPLLSFCIVTYKNAKRIRRLLSLLIPQARPEMEIVIRDDSPDNETREIVEEYSKIFPIRYFQGEKLGIDGANYFVAKEARGDYVWWFGDDTLVPNAIHHVIQTLQKNPQIDFMWINSGNEENPSDMNDGGLNWGPSRFLKDGNEALEEIADLLGFLSALVFRREAGIPSYEGAKKWMGTNFAGLYTVFYALSRPNAKVYYMAERLILGQPKLPEDQLFFDSFEVFGITFYKMLKEFEGEFKSSSIKKCLAKNFEAVWKGTLVYRAKGLTTNLGSDNLPLGKFFRLYWTFGGFWVALPFFLMPRPLVRVCYKIYKFFSPKTKNRFEKKNNF